MLNFSFFKKFVIAESKDLSGKFYSNLLVLLSIMIISLITIGFSNGALLYLGQKMDSHWVSMVTLKIPAGFQVDNKDITPTDIDLYHQDSSKNFKEYYGIESIHPIYGSILKFKNHNNGKESSCEVRVGYHNDPILKELKPEDKLTFNNKFNYEGWGCIVTKDFLTSSVHLNYSDTDVPYIGYLGDGLDGDKAVFNIPIEGVVRDLPGNIEMILGEKIYLANEYSTDFFQDHLKSDNYLSFFTDNPNAKEALIQYGFKKVEKDKQPKLHIDRGSLYHLRTKKIDSIKRIDIINFFSANKEVYRIYDLGKENLGFTYEWKDDGNKDVEWLWVMGENEEPPEKFIFKFNQDKLDSISGFNDYLKNFIYNDRTLSVDMSQIKSREYFDLFKTLAFVLSTTLIAFSILSIFIYISNLILSHISKNKKSLGTLKAFGLSSNNIIVIYLSISFLFIGGSFFLSCLICECIGIFYKIPIKNSSIIFDLKDYWKLICYFVGLPILLIYYRLRKLQSATPGNLIYERD